MTIVDRDGIINGLANNHTDLLIDKLAVINMAATHLTSLWRATGTPGQGAIPTTAAICTSALTGALPLVNQTAPNAAYLAHLWYVNTLNATSLEIHDRLAHLGGLSGTVTSAQGALNLAGLAAGRLGSTNYADVQWWLEWYTDTGATSANATAAVTYDDDSTGTSAAVTLGASARAGRLFPLRPNVPGRSIKAVNSVTLSANTGTAGEFGITASRWQAALTSGTSNKIETFDWAALGLPKIENDACLMFVAQCQGSSTGVVRGGGKIIYG